VTRAIVWAGSATALAGIVQFFAQFYYGPLVLIYIWQHSVAPILEGPHAAEELAANTNWMLWVGHVPVMRALGPFMGPPDAAQFMAICTPLALVGALALRARVGQAVSLPLESSRQALSLPLESSRQADSLPHSRLRPLALLPAVGMLIFL